MAKSGLRKHSINRRYNQMERSHPDKTNFNRQPYYLSAKKKAVESNWKSNLMDKFERVYKFVGFKYALKRLFWLDKPS